MKNYIVLSSLVVLSLGNVSDALAQRANLDDFYRPVTSGDLVTKLPPRANLDSRLSTQSDFFNFEGSGCPDEILIGSVQDDADFFGNVDIEVVVQNDIIIQCGGL